MAKRLALNTRRLLGSESRTKSVVDHAVANGVTVIDVGGSQETKRLSLNLSCRLLAKIGYYEHGDDPAFENVQGSRVLSPALAHCIDADFVEAETRRLVDMTQVPPTILLHHPEIGGPWQAALDRLHSMRKAGLELNAIGVASGDSAWLEANSQDLLRHGATVLRLPACALDPPRLRERTATLGRSFDLIGIRPLLSVSPLLQLVDNPTTEGVDRAAAQHAYLNASEAVVHHLTPPEEADEDTKAGADWLLQLVADLNEAVTKMTPSAWEYELTTQIGPMIHNKFDGLDDQTADLLFSFFQSFGKLVALTAHDNARAAAASPPTGIPPLAPDEPLVDWALRHVFHQRPELSLVSLAAESTNDLDVAFRVGSSLSTSS